MPQPIREAGQLLAQATGQAATRRTIQIITPGWGSSGHYSAAVLQEAATNRVIPAGTHMYFNHASASEAQDRPERDVRDIAAVLVEDARWDGHRLFADADILGPHAELIEALAPYIGVSISGSATEIVAGEAEGRQGRIVQGLAEVASIDFVTHAGRGGMVLLESARPSVVNALATARGVGEASANDTRDALSTVVRDTHGGEETYVWVRDFDDSTVWFEVESPDDTGLYAQAFTRDGTAVALTGERTEVRVVTTYVSVTRPDSTTTEESERETTMPQIQIEEAEHARLIDAAGRVTALEERATTAEAERDQLRTTEAARARGVRAVELVRTNEARVNASHTFSALEERGLCADLPLTAEGALDEAAFASLVTAAVTEAIAASTDGGAAGAGVRGFGGLPGGPGQPGAVQESTKPTVSPWGRPLTENKGA